MHNADKKENNLYHELMGLIRLAEHVTAAMVTLSRSTTPVPVCGFMCVWFYCKSRCTVEVDSGSYLPASETRQAQ